jgi:hypothetical protein
MKITAPKSPDQYFEDTEHAVKHAYEGLASCWRYVEEARLYERTPIEKDGMLHWLPASTPEEKAKLARSIELLKQYGNLKPSEAMFAGFILEAACMAIRLFSPHKPIPANCATFALPNAAGRFCIGKERHGVPTGLIVYAARNQYAHWDDEQLHDDTRAIFAALDASFQDKPLCDLAFDLDNLATNIYASEVIHLALGWRTYDIYLAEMKELLA